MTEPASYDAVYLSPHLDDAVLSCGGQIHRRVSRGQRVLIVTFFTGDLDPESLSELGRQVLDMMGLDAREAMAVRRREDEMACRVLGADLIHCGLLEATGRRSIRGEVIYPTAEHLFGALAIADYPQVSEVEGALRGMPKADVVISPLGIGRHVDHQIVCLAAQEVFGSSLVYYEDFPYVAWKRFAVERVLGWRKRGWQAEGVVLDPENLKARIEAIRAYGSQIAPLFKNDDGVARLVNRWAGKVGGERLWRRA